jgi:DNA-binding NtrC family response regulator
MEQFRIFLVEDDEWYGELIKYHLSLNPDYEVSLFSSGKACLEHLYLQPDVICMDYSLPDMNGHELLQSLKSSDRELPVIVISGQEDVGIAIDLLKTGVDDYIIKDKSTKELIWNSVVKIRENAKLREEVAQLKDQLSEKYSFNTTIIGTSPAIRKVFKLIKKACTSNINVSITGETGTGKELVANAIHFNSDRRGQKFVAVNMAAIPAELMESELFGHEKGAFTGAIATKKGKFEEARDGTIFLDEISELDLNLQSKLLRVLQEREVIRLGSNRHIPLNVRVIIASNKPLAAEVKQGRFREDLYYRLMGLPIQLPPLRNRGNDILILARHFADLFARENNMSDFDFTAEAREKMLGYPYPGNVRELKAIVDLACVMCNKQHIRPEDISFASVSGEDHLIAVEKTLKEYERDIIHYFLDKYNSNVVEVAGKLGIGKSKIYQMIKEGKLKLSEV